MENIHICMICLSGSNEHDLTNIANENTTDVCLRLKLEKCVPEIEWKNDYDICSSCYEKLENAYTFRELCIKSQDARCETWSKIINFEFEAKPNLKLEDNVDTPTEFITNMIELKEELIESKTFSCFYCTKQFSNKINLSRHIKSQHSILKEYFCKYCFKRYINKTLYLKHEVTCNVADENVNEAVDGLDEEYDDGNEVEKSNKCDLCGTSFNNKYLLKRHKKNVHATEKNFKCDQCPSTFVSSVYLNAHKKYHSGDRKHVCSFCGKRYITASDLYHHEKIHQNKRAYKCADCGKAFNTSSDLHKHKICVHMDRNLWKYSCEYCSRKFPLKTNLDTHIKTHTGEKNFSCHLCDKKCISRSALTRHIDTHTNVKSFKCKHCNLGYKYKKSLEIHMVKSHGVGNIKIPEKKKNFFCHLCPKSYYANSKLEKHVRSHTGDKPFKCPTCDKCFVDKSYIKQHLRSAHNQDIAE